MVAQLLFDEAGLVVAAVEDGVVLEAGAVLELVRGDLGGHPLGLVLGVAAVGHDDLVARAVLGPQALVEQLLVIGDDGVGGFQDAARGAVVLLELDDLELGVVLLQQLQVLDVRAAPGIDRLIVVAHRGEGAAHARQQLEQAVLGAVGVLVLVDEQVAQLVLPALAHFGVLVEQAHGQRDEVVEIHRLVGAQGALVFLVELGGDRGDFVVGELGGLLGRDHRVLP